MDPFFQDLLIQGIVSTLISTVKNPQSVARLLDALVKLTAVLTIAIQQLGAKQAAQLDAAINKERAKVPASQG